MTALPNPSAAMRRLHQVIAASFEEAADRPPAVRSASGHPGPVNLYGVPPGSWPALLRRWRSEIAELRLEDRLALARLFMASRVEEQGHMANAVLRAGLDNLTPASFRAIDALLDDVTSWSITDDFATGKASITASLLARFPRETLRLHARWNRSPNRWKRRASVVTFTRAVAASGRYVDETLALCAALQHDREDLVRKGAGWALKDTMRAGPRAKRRVLALVKQMRRAGVSSTITLYAIRDLRGAERQAILAVTPLR